MRKHYKTKVKLIIGLPAPSLVGTRKYKQSDRGGWQAEGFVEFGMSCGIKPERKYVRISNEGNWAQKRYK